MNAALGLVAPIAEFGCATGEEHQLLGCVVLRKAIEETQSTKIM
jgi:hypothetical protein